MKKKSIKNTLPKNRSLSKIFLFGFIFLIIGVFFGFLKIVFNNIGKGRIDNKTLGLINVPFKMTNGCHQPPGWNSTFTIFIDEIPAGTIQDCGSTEVLMKLGKHKVRITGLSMAPGNLVYTVESKEVEVEINKSNKFLLFPIINSSGNFSITFVEY